MKFSIDDLKAMDPCSEALDWLAEKPKRSLHQAWEQCERADWMLWFLREKKLIAKPISVKFAIACAERVLPIYEKKYPDDKRPRLAIEAAAAWLKDQTEANRKAAAAAYAATAYATAYAAAAAATAYAAAYAAAAADAAADAAAAYAADADAAYDAYDAAAANRAEERQWQANKLRQLVPNPFDL